MKIGMISLAAPYVFSNLTAYENRKRQVYGEYNGFNRWDLAKDWIRMSNAHFFEYYGFNFVPHGKLQDDVKRFVGRVSA
ncbi:MULTISPECIES: hypothetical protein [Bacillus cereus group]|uniref:hypothetical protein n=1 Tax=Bacillus cereus group TaxID=86661 RepID=UPI0008FE0F2C|nr:MULTISPECIES: hypothetical protein [Bacillus cereus group]HDR7875942.1 hypothetical protein [Bacillus mobilis]MBM6771584.1 hypothetical protein [Bacillus cereus]MCC2380830.1 hypothetical protein [Bacillus wiedmannii]MCC2424986.1 hypothetical protein [Bacillus wiedmannii]MCC2494413.1 hypothetical protein [Bacillus cereus]